MEWANGNVSVNHPRAPWDGRGDVATLVHCRLDQLKGTSNQYRDSATYKAAYEKAKFNYDMDIAFDIVDRCISDECLDSIVDTLLGYAREPIYIYPYMPFDDEDGMGGRVPLDKQPTNALPAAYAQYLSTRLGGSVNETIIQSARAGRTKLNTWLRYLCQPSFEGEIVGNRPYVPVDDVITTGGTLATLRSYIVSCGGTVAGTTALAHKNGVHQKFAIAEDTFGVLCRTYGQELTSYWTETFGHGPASLTDAEAQFLALFEWEPGNEPIQRLRERINQAAAKGE